MHHGGSEASEAGGGVPLLHWIEFPWWWWWWWCLETGLFRATRRSAESKHRPTVPRRFVSFRVAT
ncbi:hypothetical protein E2C01_076432 [Portunus trituberculatus]|uniref:Uncharacterized protein n=1 Tax=Portunus trituberculatus TaxID=210409 RepID=A0A5B7IM09_PORTR|nr:hypothetical protein [Portunus trituberculatus]